MEFSVKAGRLIPGWLRRPGRRPLAGEHRGAGLQRPREWYWIWPLLTLPQFTFAASGAGRVLGVDAWLRRALPEVGGGPLVRLVRLAT